MLGAGLSLLAAAGNEADLSVLDYMEYALTHEPTRVIVLLIDSLDDGSRFRRLALAAYAAGKPVVALKIGGSEAGAAAAVAHSSRLAGDDAAYHALFRASGVATVRTLEGLMTAGALLDRYGRRPGALGALSTSGAGASLIADRCEALGVPLAALAPATIEAIDSHKMFSRIGNPLDLGIFGGMRKSAEVPKLLMTDPSVSVTLALVHSMNPWQGDPYRAAMGAAREASGVPLLLVTPGGLPDAERDTYRRMGIDTFTDTDILLEGIGALMAPEPDAVNAPPTTPASILPDRPLTEPESLRLLAGFGVRTVQTVECASVAEATAAAARLGYPVVLKGVAEGVAHKSDLGLVHVGLRDGDAVAHAYESTGCRHVIVQAMARGELEAIAGVARSDGVGLVLIAGLGGIFAEALHDTVTLPIPSSRAAIEAAVFAGSLGRILTSPRWKFPDVGGTFIDLLLSLQDAALALGDRVQAIDINPVILGEAGTVAVDALVVPTSVVPPS
jgi:acyl-CoA synthetase (NDP forming)